MNKQSSRLEKDLLGEARVPSDAYFGIQTKRACENFNLSGVPLHHYPQLVNALALVKLACAKANYQSGTLEKTKLGAIEKAVKQILDGKYHDQFIVDMIQGGAGTSTNMNANEVIANIGLEAMGYEKGDYHHLHPNNDVNLSQSTNDAYPTSARLAILFSHCDLVSALKDLRGTFQKKADEFSSIIKIGRTQLQDAVPMTLGQEFQAYATTLSEDIERVTGLSDLLKEVNLGGTAIGTGINADPEYAKCAINNLCELSGFEFKQASDLVEASSDMGAFVLFSSMLKRLAIKLSKISNDLRLLSMGPRCGINEINLPPQQPGSSIMPGKINPVIPEAMNQVAYQVIGNDMTVTMAAESGQLQLNAMEPLIIYNILSSIRQLTHAMSMLNHRCVKGISANEERCRELVDNSIGIITAITPTIGYENATRIAKLALDSGRNVLELVREENLIDEELLIELMRPEHMVRPKVHNA